MSKLEKEIIQNLETFLNNELKEYEYSTSTHDSIQIYAINKKDSSDNWQLIRLGINDNNQQIYISNLHVGDLKYNGIGKKMISIVYHTGKRQNYDTLLVQLVDSFYERLLRRGALRTNEYDTLMIVDTTNLD